MEDLPPIIRCPCGSGACRVGTSHTDKNPDRHFYRCPQKPPAKACGFFKWCDDIIKYAVPACPCGAGPSSLNRLLSGPDAGRWYFACRIKKNHGACSFFQMVDFELNRLLNKFLPRLNGNSSQPCSASPWHAPTSENDDSRKGEETKSVLSSMPNLGNDNTCKDLIMTGPDSLVSAGADGTCQLSLCNSLLQQRNFFKHVYAADNSLPAVTFGQLFSLKFEGWLGRIAFPPPLPLKDPPALSFFWCVFPNFYPIRCLEDEPMADAEVVTMTLDESSNNEAEHSTQSQQAPRQNNLNLSSILPELLAAAELVMMTSDGGDDADAGMQQTLQQNDLPLSSFLSDPCGVERSSSTQAEKMTPELVLKCSGPEGILSILQSMPLSDHEKMLEVAESIFESWRRVGVDCRPFSELVKEYVHYVSRQAGVEALISKGPSSHQLDVSYREKKTEFDQACERHREMEAALEASEKQEQSMRDEASHFWEMLRRLEKNIVEYEAQNEELRSRVAEHCKEKEEAEARMQAACVKMREVWELEQRREMEMNAASGVMERLRGLLNHQ